MIRQGRNLIALMVLMGFSILCTAQAQFACHWQSKAAPTGKPSFTVNINLAEGVIRGTVILVDPAGREIESDVTNAELSGETLEFTTKVHDDTFDWRLTLKDKRHGLLHRSTGEMVIDEQVSKQRS